MADKEVKVTSVKVEQQGHAATEATVQDGDKKGSGTGENVKDAIKEAKEDSTATGGR